MVYDGGARACIGQNDVIRDQEKTYSIGKAPVLKARATGIVLVVLTTEDAQSTEKE
jgi:hypothetical protein